MLKYAILFFTLNLKCLKLIIVIARFKHVKVIHNCKELQVRRGHSQIIVGTHDYTVQCFCCWTAVVVVKHGVARAQQGYLVMLCCQ